MNLNVMTQQNMPNHRVSNGSSGQCGTASVEIYFLGPFSVVVVSIQR